jgi:hypothetical protein
MCGLGLVVLLAGKTATAAVLPLQPPVEGSLTNFDVVNYTGQYANNFEIVLNGITKSEITGFYTNPNYGNPTVTPIANGVMVIYANPQYPTAPGTTEHFGVRLPNSNLINPNTLTTYWTENSVASPTMIWPMINAYVAWHNGQYEMEDVISLNNSATSAFWVQRSDNWVQGDIQLGNLMPGDPDITGATLLDSSPRLLLPGTSVTQYSPLPSLSGDWTRILACDVYGDNYNLTTEQHIQGSYLASFYNGNLGLQQNSWVDTWGDCWGSAPDPGIL